MFTLVVDPKNICPFTQKFWFEHFPILVQAAPLPCLLWRLICRVNFWICYNSVSAMTAWLHMREMRCFEGQKMPINNSRKTRSRVTSAPHQYSSSSSPKTLHKLSMICKKTESRFNELLTVAEHINGQLISRTLLLVLLVVTGGTLWIVTILIYGKGSSRSSGSSSHQEGTKILYLHLLLWPQCALVITLLVLFIFWSEALYAGRCSPSRAASLSAMMTLWPLEKAKAADHQSGQEIISKLKLLKYFETVHTTMPFHFTITAVGRLSRYFILQVSCC